MLRLNVEYASFFNRNAVAFVNKKTIDRCNRFVYNRSGIYAIINKINGYMYIGKSKNINTRLQQHKSLLRNNHHTYRTGELSLLQKAWNKYGEDAFEFKIIELCENQKLSNREQYWISFYQCNHAKYRQGYNVTDGGDGAYSNKNVKGRIQINNGDVQKMVYPNEFSQYANQGFIRGILPETVKKLNQNRNPRCAEEHWAYGKKISDEHKRKISEANKNKTSWMKGKHWDDEHKQMLRLKSSGRKHTEHSKEKIKKAKQKSVIQYDKSGKKIAEYISAICAENETGTGRSHISQCCYKKRKSAGGYVWRFKDE